MLDKRLLHLSDELRVTAKEGDPIKSCYVAGQMDSIEKLFSDLDYIIKKTLK